MDWCSARVSSAHALGSRRTPSAYNPHARRREERLWSSETPCVQSAKQKWRRVLFRTKDIAILFMSKWVEGAAQKGFFGLKLKGKRQFAITTYRCTACGYLESYAGP